MNAWAESRPYIFPDMTINSMDKGNNNENKYGCSATITVAGLTTSILAG